MDHAFVWSFHTRLKNMYKRAKSHACILKLNLAPAAAMDELNKAERNPFCLHTIIRFTLLLNDSTVDPQILSIARKVVINLNVFFTIS